MKQTKNLVMADEVVMNKILYIRNHKVMLDKDLAELYGVTPRRLREQVKRNLNRFPENFMFQLSEDELDAKVSQNATPSKQYFGGSLPYVFTEHGVLMLANVLKSEKAVEVSLRLIGIFVRMREMLSANKDILLKLEQLEKKVINHDEEIQVIFSALKKLIQPSHPPKQRIGFRRSNESDGRKDE